MEACNIQPQVVITLLTSLCEDRRHVMCEQKFDWFTSAFCYDMNS
jgi:hypothetical protein